MAGLEADSLLSATSFEDTETVTYLVRVTRFYRSRSGSLCCHYICRMTPRIETLPARKLIGIRATMSLVNNSTGKLWAGFMPRRKEITNRLQEDLISLQVYPLNYFKPFNPATIFEKWAATEVADFEAVPDGLETFTLSGGLYAVFNYKGPAGDPAIFQYLFGTWLPSSSYELDDRPHFEVLGPKYSNTDPSSEEEIWIPVKPLTASDTIV